MQFSRTDIDALNVVVKLTVEPQDYQEKVEKQLKEIRRRADIPGFRKGMVPLGLVRKMYGKGVLADPFSCNKAVGNVVKLLENHGGKQRKAEAPENRRWFSLRQVTVHKARTSFFKDSWCKGTTMDGQDEGGAETFASRRCRSRVPMSMKRLARRE